MHIRRPLPLRDRSTREARFSVALSRNVCRQPKVYSRHHRVHGGACTVRIAAQFTYSDKELPYVEGLKAVSYGYNYDNS